MVDQVNILPRTTLAAKPHMVRGGPWLGKLAYFAKIHNLM